MKSTGNHLIKALFFLAIMPFMLALPGCDKDDDMNFFTDARDGQQYKIVTIGGQTWMAENLNYIPTSGNSWCYDDDAGNCITYGRLYDWEAATNAAPDGWRLPTDADWATLINFLGGEAEAGGHLKEAGLTHWETPNTGADNSSGFTALPAGSRVTGLFIAANTSAFFWSSTENPGDASQAFSRYLYHTGADVVRATPTKPQGFSIRCIMN